MVRHEPGVLFLLGFLIIVYYTFVIFFSKRLATHSAYGNVISQSNSITLRAKDLKRSLDVNLRELQELKAEAAERKFELKRMKEDFAGDNISLVICIDTTVLRHFPVSYHELPYTLVFTVT